MRAVMNDKELEKRFRQYGYWLILSLFSGYSKSKLS
jgi:hypothetical protein